MELPQRMHLAGIAVRQWIDKSSGSLRPGKILQNGSYRNQVSIDFLCNISVAIAKKGQP
jgi:hypothetical protein